MVKYQNIDRSANRSTYVEVGDRSGAQALITSKTTNFTPVSGALVGMTAGAVRVVRAVQASTSCGLDCPPMVDNSVEVKFNVFKDDHTTFAELKAEAVRLIDEAWLTYNLGLGIVPPSEATFEQE